jgi:mRNA interferase MazF
MMRAGEVVRVDFGIPQGSEPGFERPAVVVTANVILQHEPRTVHVVPLTTNVRRRLPTEVLLDVEGLLPSSAQCHLLTVVSSSRIDPLTVGTVDAVALAQIREVIEDLLDLG